MREVTVDPVSKTIKAQGGCLWVDVDEAAWEHGLATVGGTVNHTGIGGLTLGGGYGWLSGMHGLVIDNLIAVQMVLADGSIVTASESENSDLFWAVRGAGHAFGVIVEFTYRAHPQESSVWAGLLAFPPNNLETFVTASNQVIAASQGDSGLMLCFTQLPRGSPPVVIAVVYFNGPAAAAEKFFAPVLDLGPVLNTTAEIPYPELNAMINPANTHGERKIFKGASFVAPLDPAFFQSVFDDYVHFLTEIPGVSATIIFEYVTTDKICTVPHSATAFANRGPYQNALICPRWTDAMHDQACKAWVKEMAGKFVEETKRGKSEDEKKKIEAEGVKQYGNYDSKLSLDSVWCEGSGELTQGGRGIGLIERGPVIFGSNYDRVVQLKKKYDAKNVFNKSHVRIEV